MRTIFVAIWTLTATTLATSAELPLVASPENAWGLFARVGAGLGNSDTIEPGPANAVGANFLGYVADSLIVNTPAFGAGNEDTVRVFRAIASADRLLTFSAALGGDDGVSLYVNGLRAGGEGNGPTVTFDVTLQLGNNLLEIYHYNGPGGAVVHLSQSPFLGPPISELDGVVLVGASPLIGDADGDFEVGAVDYAIWAATFGDSGPGLRADFNGDEIVGAADYALWAANFGKVGFSGAAIPEPSAITLSVIGAIGLALLYRRLC